jgi:cytochrome c biogenesis protein ResB
MMYVLEPLLTHISIIVYKDPWFTYVFHIIWYYYLMIYLPISLLLCKYRYVYMFITTACFDVLIQDSYENDQA